MDCGVTVQWFVEEENHEQARAILNSFREKRVEFVIPEFIYAEFGNVLWKEVQRQEMTAEEARGAIARFQALRLPTIPTRELLDDAFSLAITHKRTVYDSLYLALMERERCVFVTTDERLFNAVSAALPNVRLLRDFTL